MTEQAKIERLLRLINLLTGPFYFTISQLAEKLETTERTIFRYILTFQDAGFVIKNENSKYKLLKENKQGAMLYDLLHFSQEEAFLLSKAIHSVDGNNIIKNNIIKKLYSLYDFDKAAEAVINPQYSANVHHLLQAINEKKQVILHNYQSAHSNNISNRLVEAFEFTTDFISIWCYETESNSNKLFKTARISTVEITKHNWQHTSLHKKGYIDIFRISSFEKIPVTLLLSLRACNLLKEEYPLSAEFIKPGDNNQFIFDGWVCSFNGISRFCMGLINEIQIIQPETLKQEIQKKITNFLSTDRS